MFDIYKGALVPEKFLLSVNENISYNNLILNYYKTVLKKDIDFINKYFYCDLDTIKNKIENIESCNKFWELDFYVKSKIKDFKRTNLCRDKFCNNCKKVLQSSRMAKYMPHLENYSENSFLLTLTVPNCSGDELPEVIKKMSKSYTYLNRIFKNDLKLRVFDFSMLNYLGSIRSLEVTFKDDSYHPHYHCLLVFDNLKDLEKKNINDFSYSYGAFKTKFSDLEILIQKLWYLIYNGLRCSKKNIEQLSIGYSCKLDKLKTGDYNEIFKYLTKGTTEDNNFLSFEHFCNLYRALYRCKQIQGYGVFYNVTDEGDIESCVEAYDEFIQKLKDVELPVTVYDTVKDLLKDKDNILISRKSYFKYIKNLPE